MLSAHLDSGLLEFVHQPAGLGLRLRQSAVGLGQLGVGPGARLLSLLPDGGQLAVGLLPLGLRAAGRVRRVLQLLQLLLERVVLALQAAVDRLQLLEVGGGGGARRLQLHQLQLPLLQPLLGGAQQLVVLSAQRLVLQLLLLKLTCRLDRERIGQSENRGPKIVWMLGWREDNSDPKCEFRTVKGV